MNPWPLIIALIIVLLIKAFHWVFAVGYDAGVADGKMKAKAEEPDDV